MLLTPHYHNDCSERVDQEDSRSADKPDFYAARVGTLEECIDRILSEQAPVRDGSLPILRKGERSLELLADGGKVG